MIIGLSGYARAGKDTVANILVREYGFVRLAFADKLKEFVYRTRSDVATAVDARGWERAKEAAWVRRVLQDVGDGARETFGADFWVQPLEAQVDDDPLFFRGERHYVVSDVRYLSEAQWVASYARTGHVVRVVRPGVEPANGHRSETEVDGWPFGYVLENDRGLTELADEVDSMTQYFGWRKDLM